MQKIRSKCSEKNYKKRKFNKNVLFGLAINSIHVGLINCKKIQLKIQVLWKGYNTEEQNPYVRD